MNCPHKEIWEKKLKVSVIIITTDRNNTFRKLSIDRNLTKFCLISIYDENFLLKLLYRSLFLFYLKKIGSLDILTENVW